MSILRVLAVAVSLLFLVACDSSKSPRTDWSDAFVIEVPSLSETTFGEARDIYVRGALAFWVTRPGNVRIELFKGTRLEGEPVRLIESSVDLATGTTPLEALYLDYPNGERKGGKNLIMVPDIVQEPEGFLFPGNKVVVTKEYFAGVILGGVTRNFDTDYSDALGRPLEDLLAGTYTLRVTGLSGDLADAVWTMPLSFGHSHKLIGRFRPPEHAERLKAHAREQGLRIFQDPFPGYYWSGNDGYEIQTRWRANNALEVVNTTPGIHYGPEINAVNDAILYNISPWSVTETIELANIVAHDFVDKPQTTFLYYSIGEPSLTLFTPGGETHLWGDYLALAPGQGLVMVRAEIQTPQAAEGDNRYRVNQSVVRAYDLEVGDGIQAAAGEVIALFGIARPIPSTVTPTGLQSTYSIDNHISTIRYEIGTAAGETLLTTEKSVGLNRIYDPAKPDELSPSVYEFKHELVLDAMPGSFRVKATGMDSQGLPVAGAEQVFSLEIAAP